METKPDNTTEQILNGLAGSKKQANSSGPRSASSNGLAYYALRRMDALEFKFELDKAKAETAALDKEKKSLEKGKTSQFFYGFVVGAVVLMWLSAL